MPESDLEFLIKTSILGVFIPITTSISVYSFYNEKYLFGAIGGAATLYALKELRKLIKNYK